jgi:hypothetical protein
VFFVLVTAEAILLTSMLFGQKLVNGDLASETTPERQA